MPGSLLNLGDVRRTSKTPPTATSINESSTLPSRTHSSTMAPSSNAAKNIQGSRPRPTVVQSVVPALPIQYVQKRKQAAIAKKQEVEESADAPAPVVQTDLPPTQSADDISPQVANESSDTHESGSLKTEADELVQSTPATTTTTTEEEHAAEAVTEAIITEPEDANARVESSSQPEATPLEHHEDEAQEVPQSVAVEADAQSTGSRSTYQMPPPFYPANHGHQHSQEAAKLSTQPAFNGHHPMHQANVSSGSVVFGGYAESNNSSPAPPPSAGNFPHCPPQQQSLHNGRANGVPANGNHHPHMSNGFSPMGPPPGYYLRHDNFMNQNPGAESYARRQIPSFNAPDNYSPSSTPVGIESQRFPPFVPSTPHSFQGSQSSAPNETETHGPAFYSQYPTAGVTNGANGHIEDVRLYQQPRQKPRTGSQQMAPPVNFPPMPPPPGMDNLDGLVSYLQAQFADPTVADYTLELRYSDDRAPPVRIPGHNIMFARSPTLKAFMTAQAQDNNSDLLSVRTLLIQSHDRFLRSDAFWMAVQRLYGGPLLDVGVLGGMNNVSSAQSVQNMPGSPGDRFDLALGYAAAGQILQIPPVINRGVEIASQFVNWVTLEKAIDFALDGGLDPQWTLEGNMPHEGGCPSTYGPAVNMLIHTAMNFIINSFPPNFALDIAVGSLAHVRRLPIVPEERPSVSNSRLSYISFGALPSEETVRTTSGNAVTTTLSKILLNLPFHLLKYVLESHRLGNVNAWATTALRQKVMQAVIEEREKRRQRVHDSQFVSSSERTSNGRQWEVVGWQEALAPPYGGGEVPSLTRTWVDFVVPGRDS